MQPLVIKLQGGLGNQLFQYAFGLSVSKKLNAALYFDLSFYKQNHGLVPRAFALDIFTGGVNIASHNLVSSFLTPGLVQKILNKTGISKKSIYRENSLRFNNDVFNVKPTAYFEGFWQSEQYFGDIEQAVRHAFTFKAPLNPQSQTIANKLAGEAGSVSVHIRRGDYVISKTTSELHGICNESYYKSAITLIKEKVSHPRFYFFSDDPEWVKQQLLPATDNATLINHNTDTDSWQDMALMSKCKHHIIANSSFSWWGAWLNPGNQKIVIAPRNWFNNETAYFDATDLVPDGWIRLAND